ncbi:MAG TPA: PGPGW domain-containing protein [Gammaproteobacteria bacterium]
MVKLLDLVAAYAPWLVAISVVSLLIGALLVPAMIVRIPPDYFLPRRRRRLAAGGRHPAAKVALAAAKNGLGALLLLVGVALLFLPGQGLLTLLAGLTIMDYPGKYAFERWLVRRPRVLPALNWLRARYGRRPLIAP